MTKADSPSGVMSTAALLEHWQGHRRLTRRVIEAFPEDQISTFSLGGMRSFGEMVRELLSMGAPMLRGIATGQWETNWDRDPIPKSKLLAEWDRTTKEINELWPQISAEKLKEKMTAFGQYDGIAYDLLFYVIDNEIHHRGQGYVYLRVLGVEPPPFWERQ